jgi:signal transduction histidine kinase
MANHTHDRESAVGHGRDILVVDDNDANLVAIEAALEPLGRTLVLARSGTEALHRLLDQDFALILLDVAMPGMDGFETAKLVRARERSRTTPIIFVTGVAWHDDSVLRGYDLGAFDYMTKPIRAEVLRAKAQVFVDLQERTMELHRAQRLAHERELDAQRRRLETAAMERQVSQLIEMDRRKDEFLAILAHELRNPLQPLLSSVELIDATADTPLSDRTRTILKRHIHHLNRLVGDLLDVARFNARKLVLRRELVSIDHVIDQAILQCRSAIEGRMHDLDVTHAGDRAVVSGDPVRLVQIVANLVTNAARYTPPNGRIEIAASIDTDQVLVRVTDNGRGISAVVLPRIFEMFVQERVASDGGGGLGLGLALAKQLADLHGGTISGASEGETKGSTFELRLPLADPAVAPEPPAPDRPVVSLEPLRAVICDDAPDVRDLVADMLRSHGHQVTTVGDGPAALQAIVQEKPNVALIDIALPGMSGYDVARAVRQELVDPRPRLVAMTGYGQDADRRAAFEAGFDAHVTKPATADVILDALRGSAIAESAGNHVDGERDRALHRDAAGLAGPGDIVGSPVVGRRAHDR